MSMYRPQILIVRALHRQRMRKFFCAFDRLSQYFNYHTSKDLILPSSQTRKLSGSHWLHLHSCVQLIAVSVNTDSSTQSLFINSEEHHMIWLPVKESPAETRQRIALQRYAAEKSLRRDCSGRISCGACGAVALETCCSNSLGPAQFGGKEGFQGNMNAGCS